MDHIAILRKARISKGGNLLKDILEGKKTVESRWYVNKICPWDQITRDDTVYFKESGCPVTAKARVEKVLQIDNITHEVISEIIDTYGKEISPGTTRDQWTSWASEHYRKRYCILMFLKDVEKVTPFNINKTGYGCSCAWLSVKDINYIRC